jgi:uncharacterized protein (TIGR00156 family)
MLDISLKKGTPMKKIIFAILLCVAMPSYAQLDSTATTTNVQSVLANPENDQRVMLRGTIVSNDGDESYQFTDGTGQISLSIENRLLWGQNLVKGTPVEIEGEMEKRWFSDKFDFSVDRVQVLKKDSAEASKPGAGS